MEVTIALGVAGFALIAVFGLLPIGITSSHASVEQTTAANIARGLVADLRATPKTTGTSSLYSLSIPATGTSSHTLFLREDGTSTGPQDTDASPSKNPRFRATLVYNAPTAPQRMATSVRLLLSWPALADPQAASTPRNFAGSYEILTTLDRN